MRRSTKIILGLMLGIAFFIVSLLYLFQRERSLAVIVAGQAAAQYITEQQLNSSIVARTDTHFLEQRWQIAYQLNSSGASQWLMLEVSPKNTLGGLPMFNSEKSYVVENIELVP